MDPFPVVARLIGMSPNPWPRASLWIMAVGGAAWLLVAASAPAGAESAPRPVKPSPRPARPEFRLELGGDGGRALPTFALGGRTYALGRVGARYRIRIVNPTAGRVEAVVSVDGLDAVDGKPASVTKRGYILPAFGEASIDGFRTSMDEVATFRFATVRDSYAARKGDARNVGVVGAAFFRERARDRDAIEPSDAQRDAPAPRGAAKAERSGIGTEFGERRVSVVQATGFERASTSPASVIEVRYDDRAGLVRLGIPLDDEREPEGREAAQPFPEDRFATPP